MVRADSDIDGGRRYWAFNASRLAAVSDGSSVRRVSPTSAAPKLTFIKLSVVKSAAAIKEPVCIERLNLDAGIFLPQILDQTTRE